MDLPVRVSDDSHVPPPTFVVLGIVLAAASCVDRDELVYVLARRSEVSAAIDLEIDDLLPGSGGLRFVALPKRQDVIIAVRIYDGYSCDAVHR